MQSIAVAGHVCLDLTPSMQNAPDVTPGRLIEVGAMTATAGGSVANTGAALLSLGAAVTPYASVGADDLGALLVAKLGSLGFANPSLTAHPSASTSYSVVIERAGADRTFWHHTGANDTFDGSDIPVEKHGLLHVGYPSLLPRTVADRGNPLRHLLERARAAGATTSLDLAVVDPASAMGGLDWAAILESAVAHTDVISPSLDDLTSALRIEEDYSPELADRLANLLLDFGAAVVAISAGVHGIHLKTAGVERLQRAGTALSTRAETWADRSLYRRPQPIANAVTTNGAGDASTAGLLFAISRDAEPEEAIDLAIATSAAVIAGRRPTLDATFTREER